MSTLTVTIIFVYSVYMIHVYCIQNNIVYQLLCDMIIFVSVCTDLMRHVSVSYSLNNH